MSGYIVLIGHQPYEAAGPFSSRSGAEAVMDVCHEAGVRAIIVPLSTGRDAKQFYSGRIKTAPAAS